MTPIALLSYDGSTYTFAYLPAASTIAGFRPLLGFRDLSEVYTSDELFPLFQERVLDPTRSDFARVVHGLKLDPAEATPWEQLVHSGGGSEGDTLQVTPLPHQDGDGWSCYVLAAGLRYFQSKTVRTEAGETRTYTEDEFERVLEALSPGDVLTVRREIGNDYNPAALLLFTENDDVIGYLPDWLARFVEPMSPEGVPDLVVRVERITDKSAGWHLRLMVSVHGPDPFEETREKLRTGRALRY
ncbi:HIRAN domain-containing protein [Humibacter ginsengisoli]